MLFVETASNFASGIEVARCDTNEPVDGKSIMQMMMLAATQGTEIKISATGEDADEAIAELAKLVQSQFEED